MDNLGIVSKFFQLFQNIAAVIIIFRFTAWRIAGISIFIPDFPVFSFNASFCYHRTVNNSRITNAGWFRFNYKINKIFSSLSSLYSVNNTLKFTVTIPSLFIYFSPFDALQFVYVRNMKGKKFPDWNEKCPQCAGVKLVGLTIEVLVSLYYLRNSIFSYLYLPHHPLAVLYFCIVLSHTPHNPVTTRYRSSPGIFLTYPHLSF